MPENMPSLAQPRRERSPSPNPGLNPGPNPGTMHDEVRQRIAAIFGVAPARVVGRAALVEDLGASSLDFVELVMNIEDGFKIEISDDAAAAVVTVDDLEALIRRRQLIEHGFVAA